MKARKWLISKVIETELKKSDIKVWEKDTNDEAETWVVSEYTIEKLDDDCC